MKGTEVTATAPGPLSRGAEALPWADEAKAILQRNRRRSASNLSYRRGSASNLSFGMPRKKFEVANHKRADQSLPDRRLSKALLRKECKVWLQTITRQKFRKRHREPERCVSW